MKNEADQYLDSLSESDRSVINNFRKIISETDASVKESFGSLMASGNAFCYTEQGVFKYGIVKNKDFFSFHSMVIYGSPKLMEVLKTQLKKARFQKGCINFKDLSAFPPEIFQQHMETAASFDFSGIVAHYKKKQKN